MAPVLSSPDTFWREVNPTMAKNFRKIVVLCASAFIVLLAIACSSQPPQDTTKPATETSQAPAPAQDQQAPKQP